MTDEPDLTERQEQVLRAASRWGSSAGSAPTPSPAAAGCSARGCACRCGMSARRDRDACRSFQVDRSSPAGCKHRRASPRRVRRGPVLPVGDLRLGSGPPLRCGLLGLRGGWRRIAHDRWLGRGLLPARSLGGQRHERLDHRAVAVARQLHQNRVAGRVILGVERAQIAARGRHRAVELSGLFHPRAAAWLRLVVW